ncbi:hypothetical protein Tsubulata_050317 [Turnera subulata]|uniref:DUF4283 domain-containing protein n=1 Tax=Turnera subulata TaxID=218843 RepID=A0A9Q0F1W9_9ROSI|nr:hypothetical protein Tsubulata_050317 [Turnera subulata]
MVDDDPWALDEEPICEDGDIMVVQEANGENVVLSDAFKRRLEKPWENGVVVKLLGREIGYRALQSKIQTLWKPAGPFRIIDLEGNFYIIRFLDSRDYIHALTGGSWAIYGHALCVQPWCREFRAESGKVDKTESQTRAKFAKVAVAVDLSKPLKGKVKFDGESFKVVYEGISQICFSCGHYGHSAMLCSYHTVSKGKEISGSDASISPSAPVPNTGGQVSSSLQVSILRKGARSLSLGTFPICIPSLCQWGPVLNHQNLPKTTQGSTFTKPQSINRKSQPNKQAHNQPKPYQKRNPLKDISNQTTQASPSTPKPKPNQTNMTNPTTPKNVAQLQPKVILRSKPSINTQSRPVHSTIVLDESYHKLMYSKDYTESAPLHFLNPKPTLPPPQDPQPSKPPDPIGDTLERKELNQADKAHVPICEPPGDNHFLPGQTTKEVSTDSSMEVESTPPEGALPSSGN